MVTGQDHPLVHHNRLAFTGLLHFRVARNAARGDCGLIDVGVHQTEFQRRGCAQNLFSTCGILDTRQLYHDTVSTLTLYQRFSYAKLVNTVTQDVDVLLNRVFTRFFQTLIGHHRTQLVAALRREHQVAMTLGQVIHRLIAGLAVAERDAHPVIIFLTHGGVRDAFVAQIATQAVDVLFLEFAKRGFHIDFHQEVYAATQVETEFHRFRVDRS